MMEKEKKLRNIMIQNVGSDQKSMDSLGTGTYGMNNIVIAPNVLETMANDPKKAAYYEKMIQDFFASQSTVKAQMAVGGLRFNLMVWLFTRMELHTIMFVEMFHQKKKQR